MKNKIILFCVTISILIFFGCGRTENTITTEDNLMEYSRLLRVTPHDGYRVAEIINSKDSTIIDATYILIDNDSNLPDSFPSGIVIRTPIDKLTVFSTVFTGALEELGKLETVKGVVDAEYFSQSYIKEGLKKGTVIDLGPSSSPSMERLAALAPQAILMSIYEGMDVKGIDKAGIPLIRMCDNLESEPLARAEWIRFIGMLTGTEHKADSIFAEVTKEYTKLKTEVAQYKNKPKVLTENMYQGVWYVPGGDSYQVRIIKDAGGTYPWQDDKTKGSLSLSFEEVLQKGNDADIWLLKLYNQRLTRDGLLSMDSRYAHFKAVDNGGVYYADTGTCPLFEEFPYHPERLLKDYILIFHPEAKGQLRYFTPMSR